MDPGFFLGGGAPLRNGVTACHLGGGGGVQPLHPLDLSLGGSPPKHPVDIKQGMCEFVESPSKSKQSETHFITYIVLKVVASQLQKN